MTQACEKWYNHTTVLSVLIRALEKKLAFRHCLRFSHAKFPGGAEAYSILGRTAWIREG
jgi:hypothetical protein